MKKSTGDLYECETTEASLGKILQLPLAKDVEVLTLDAPTKANSSTGQAGTDAFRWAGMAKRKKGRRVIHVSSLGTFADKQTIRNEVNLRKVSIGLFTRSHYIMTLSDPELKKQVCDTLEIRDPDSVSVEDVVDQKFFYSGINTRWFYNQSISDIQEECTEIIKRLNESVSSRSKDPSAVNSAVATILGSAGLLTVDTGTDYGHTSPQSQQTCCLMLKVFFSLFLR